MKRSTTITVVGGDLRQVCLARLLAEDGHSVSVYALERQTFSDPITVLHDPKVQFAPAKAIVLPMPVAKDSTYLNAPLSNASHRLRTIFDAIPSGKTVLCGAASPAIFAYAQTNHLRLIDYLKREELAVRNAVPTAEGALQIAMEELLITLHGAKALVIGFGRIGRQLARKLQALGADTTVSARSHASFAQIWAEGFSVLDTRALTGHLQPFDVIFNTVPARVIGAAELAEISADCLLIDLASKPGGIDFASAEVLERKVIWALSLPGKVAPISSAVAIRETIYHILEEEGIL